MLDLLAKIDFDFWKILRISLLVSSCFLLLGAWIGVRLKREASQSQLSDPNAKKDLTRGKISV